MNTTATAAVVTPFIDTVSDLLAHNRIPTLDAGQMSDFSRYLFTASNRTERIQVSPVFRTALRSVCADQGAFHSRCAPLQALGDSPPLALATPAGVGLGQGVVV